MRPLLFIDFETQSEVNLKTHGSYRYVEGAFFQPACMAYSVNDSADIGVWVPGLNAFPLKLMQQCQLIAFNVEFEYNVLKSRWFKWEGLDFSWLTVDHFVDVQAVAAAFGFPTKLEKLAEALNVYHKKDAKGTRLINQLCVIKKGKVPTPKSQPAKFHELYEYCKQDIRTTRACYDMLIKKDLSAYERMVFNHMMEQNQIGLPIDIESVKVIRRVLENYVERCNDRLFDLTNGEISAGTQVQKITNYIQRKFPQIDSIAAPIIKDILDNGHLDSHCREILELRQQVSHSSTAKFQRLIDRVNSNNRIQGNLKYYGGHTGRFAGVGFQMHNLPRAKHENPDEVINHFKKLSINDLIQIYGNLSAAASKLIRPMVKAPKGKMLCVADYVSIENVLLHWAANDKQTIKDFENELDQYKTYAARRFSVHYDDVTSKQRTYAKPCILGLGFGGGAAALQRVATGYGIELSDRAAENDKRFYRETFPMIPELWYKVNDAMIKAVERETIIQLNTGTISLQFIKRGTYAFIILPSGRFLCYPAPQIQRDAQYDNKCLTYMGTGTDSYTKKWRRLGDQHRVVKGFVMPDMPIHGGRLVENIIQAMARDLLVNGTTLAKEYGYKVIGSVHDEVITEIDEQTATSSNLKKFCTVICNLPDWAKGVPLRAEGYIAKRYRKD